VEPRPPDLKNLLDACARGEPEARAQFQETYGTLIYTFPVAVGRVPQDEAAAFYLYAFGHVSKEEQSCRVCKRSRSFTGRNGVPFEAFLKHVVLPAILCDWQREQERKRLDTVSLETPRPRAGTTAAGEQTLGEVLPTPEPTPEEASARRDIARALQQMDEESRLLLKLLALGTVDCTRAEINALARLAACSPDEMEHRLDAVQTALAGKAMQEQEKWDKLPEIAAAIAWQQRQLFLVERQIRDCCARGDLLEKHRLTQEKAECERLLRWRYEQQARVRHELQQQALRPSYKDIATILHVPPKDIPGKIARARAELRQRLGDEQH